MFDQIEERKFLFTFQFQLSWPKSSESTILWHIRFLSFTMVRCEKKTMSTRLCSHYIPGMFADPSPNLSLHHQNELNQEWLCFLPQICSSHAENSILHVGVRPNFIFSWASPDHIRHSGVIEQSLANQPLHAALACAGRPAENGGIPVARWCCGLWGLAKDTATNSAKLKAGRTKVLRADEAHPCHHRPKFGWTGPPRQAPRNPEGWPCPGAGLCTVLPVFFFRSLEINVVSHTCDDSRNLISDLANPQSSWNRVELGFQITIFLSHHGTLWIKGIQPFGIQVWASAHSISPVTLRYFKLNNHISFWSSSAFSLNCPFHHIPSLESRSVFASLAIFSKHLLRFKRMLPLTHVKTIQKIYENI